MRTNQHARMYQNQHQQNTPAARAAQHAAQASQQAAQASQQARMHQNQAQQFRQMSQMYQQRQAQEARQHHGARQIHKTKIGAYPAIIRNPNHPTVVRNPSKDEIDHLLDQAVRQQQDTIIRVDMDEGQEIELSIQHDEGETKITLKKPHTKSTEEKGITTPPNSPDIPRREPRTTNLRNEQATIPRVKIPIPVLVPKTTEAQEDRHAETPMHGQYACSDRSATPKPPQAQDNKHPIPMEEGHHNHNNKPLLEQGLGRGSRPRGLQGEKQQEAPGYSGQGLGRGSRFFNNLGKGEKQKEVPINMDVETEDARVTPEVVDKYSSYLYDDYEDDGFSTREQCKRLYQAR